MLHAYETQDSMLREILKSFWFLGELNKASFLMHTKYQSLMVAVMDYNVLYVTKSIIIIYACRSSSVLRQTGH
jgi:hypothetical protein